MIEPFQSEKINELALSLSKAQAEFAPVPKSRTVDFLYNGQRTKYNYADLSDFIDAVKGPMAKYGLSHTQQLVTIEGRVVLWTRILHSSGQWILSTYPLTLGAKPQDAGSAITYARRYTLSALLGVQSEDDDDGASAPPLEPPKKPKPPLPPEIAVKPKTPRRAKPIASDLDYAAKRATYAKIIALEKELSISNENMVTFLQNQFETDSADLLTLAEMNVAIIELEKMRTIINPADATWAQNHSAHLGDERDVK